VTDTTTPTETEHQPCMDAEGQFLVVFEAPCDLPDRSVTPAHRTFRVLSGQEVSRMYDLADCDYMEDVVQVLAIGNDGTLRPVTAGKSRRVDTDDESPGLYFATAPLVTDDGRRVGTVHHTDH
jgi:hypothetical protein